MADVVRPQVRTRSRRARRVVNFSQIPQLDHVRRDLNAERTYAVGQKGKREKRLPITLLIETPISNVGECVRLEYRNKHKKKDDNVKTVEKNNGRKMKKRVARPECEWRKGAGKREREKT